EGACGTHTSGGACKEGAGTEGMLQRKAQSQLLGTQGLETVPPIAYEVVRSPGQPLDVAMRAFFEPRFGHDVSRVRVHTGEPAARPASSLHAAAYTVGNHIVFGAGRYDPQTTGGLRLLNHELMHFSQQRYARPVPAPDVEPRSSEFEH